DFPEPPAEWQDKKLQEKWSRVLRIRGKANMSLETARRAGQIGSSLEAKVIFSGGQAQEREILNALQKELPSILIVSEIEMNDGEGPLEISVEKASGKKC